MIKFKTSDSKVFEVDRNIVKGFKTIDDIIECLGEDAFNVDPIPLKQVKSIIFKPILQWAAHHKNDKPSDSGPTLTDFDRKFIVENDDNIFEIVNAANFLGFEQLFSMLCRDLASELSNKSTEEIRKRFGIEEKKPKLM